MLGKFVERYPGEMWNPNAIPPPIPWLVDGLWLRGGITAVLGPEKSGKSRFIGWILAQMLGQQNGGPVLLSKDGRVVLKHRGFKRILYLNAEERTSDVQARVNAYARYCGLEPKVDWPITCVNSMGMQLQLDRERKEFEAAYLKPGGYDVVVIDPLRRVHLGDESSNTAMAPLHNDLRRWSNQYETAIVIVHHTPKLDEDADLGRLATWSRGATDLPTLVDGANMLRTMGSGPNLSVRELWRMGRFPVLNKLKLDDFGDPAPDGKPNEGGAAGFLLSAKG